MAVIDPRLTAEADLLVSGGTVVTPDGARPADVAISGEQIVAVLPPGEGTGRRVLDARGLYVLPGLIDSHVHFRTPGLTHKEDWAHGSRAAVAGGFTTVIEMPNTVPPTFTASDARAKAGMIEGNSLVDFRLHAGVDPNDLDKLMSFSPREATTAKGFLTGHHTAPNVLRDDGSLEKLFDLGGRLGLRLLFHAEDDGVFTLLDGWLGEPKRYTDYERHRPRSAGIVAVARLIELCRRYETPVHVLHVSSREEVDLLAAAAVGGLPITFETTGHHLSFTAADTARLGPRIRLSPAIRDAADNDRLWAAIFDGELATLGSDHAPHTIAEKSRPPADAPPGLPGVQELFQAVYTGMRRRQPDRPAGEHLSILVGLLAANPARLFGLDARKGALATGYDADLVLFDAEQPWMFSSRQVQAKCGWSAYEGWTMTGRVRTTMRRGQVVYRAGDGGTEATFGEPDGVWLPAAARTRAASPILLDAAA